LRQERRPNSDIENLESKHRKSVFKTPARRKFVPGSHAKMKGVRSADRRKRPRSGFTALVPRSRLHRFRRRDKPKIWFYLFVGA
jgi:hypothetical protein